MGNQVRSYRKLKRILIVLILVIAVFAVYVEIVNRNSVNMTYKQKVLKAIYPLWMWLGKLSGKNNLVLKGDKQPPQSFYEIPARKINGEPFDLGSLKGKKVLIVNTASDCGYTNQYDALQELAEKYEDKLVVLGFPANDFKEQEKGSDEEIARFCKVNFGVSFPLMQKSSVIRSGLQNPVYQWLTDPSKNGWNKKQPSWNFCKYLVDEQGVLKNYFGSVVSPGSDEIIKAIEE